MPVHSGITTGTGVLLPGKSKKAWLGYNPDFVYRYRPISPDASWSQVEAMCVEATLRASDG